MTDQSAQNIPEIMILSDDDEEPPATAISTAPKLPGNSLEIVPISSSQPPALAPIEDPVVEISAVQPPAQNKEQPPPEPMSVDNDSDLEFIEEVEVVRDGEPVPTSKKKRKPLPEPPLVDLDEPSPQEEEKKQVENEKSQPEIEKNEPEIEKKHDENEHKLPDNEEKNLEIIPPVEDASEALPTTMEIDEEPDKKSAPAEAKEDVIKTEKVKRKTCCNIDCSMSNNEFSEADLLAKNFFEVKHQNKIQDVCQSCSRSVGLFRTKCLDILEKQQAIIDAVQYLPSKEMVVLDDSDEETNPQELLDDKEKLNIDCDMVNDVVAEFEMKYKINLQDELCSEALNKAKAEIEDDFTEIDKGLSKCYEMLDDCYDSVYSPWFPETKCVGTLDTDVDTYPRSVAQYQPQEKRRGAVAMKKVTQVHHARFTQQQQSASSLPDVIAEVPTVNASANLAAQKVPPKGPLQNHTLVVGDFVYAMKSGLYHEWLKAKIMEIVVKSNEQVFKIKFFKSTAPCKNLNGKQITYCEPSKHQFDVGTRVIALFHNPEEFGLNKYLFYAGIIAECIKVTNNYRYLIFFDDGCTQYVPHENVRLIYKRSAHIWDDCHPDIRDFIKNYLEMYPERPMVRLAVNQKVKTEWNTRWWLTRVKEVDCSLVLVHFEADNRTEWIYRGSQRLAPLYYEMQKKQLQKNSKTAVRLHRGFASNANRKNHPEIEYPRMLDDDDERQKVSRAVAKKSTVNRSYTAPSVPTMPERRENFGKLTSENMGPGKWMKPYAIHACTFRCVNESATSYKEGDRISCNPLLIPLFQGWGREMTTFRNTKMHVLYRGPCGRRLRNMKEVMRYLRITKSRLCADLFSFDFALKIEVTFRVENPLYSIKDISYGSENVKIPCVNTINHNEYPMYVNYSTARTPSSKTFINYDPGFLVCCDCTDDCLDKTKCACHKLTVEEARTLDPNQDPNKVGYDFRRLSFSGQQTSAIYECNKYCKCSVNCLNRVVQHKMKCQLQLFKTEKRGWGLRALTDIPSGTFLCIYAGQIMTEQEGNEEGKQFGDEYLAELDYIEVLERCKEGYESDVSDIEDADFDGSKCNEEESDDSNEADLPGQAPEDKEFMSSLNRMDIGDDGGDKRMSLRKRKEADSTEGSQVDVEEEDNMHRGEVKAPKGYNNPQKGTKEKENHKVSIRYYIDKSEDIYVMDAKSVGNLGRYFNHSCDPNVIVQNVFVDVHDLRFPWVAFFTKRHVPAGTELCWDYNYEIGSLPDRRLDCYCETVNCRGRLL